MATITHSGNLPDSAAKTDFYAIIDNGTITSIANADIAAGAAIADSKLATISTAGKVNTSALTTTSQAAGDVIYNDGTNWVRLGKDAGKYLKSGASTVSWDNPTNASAISKAWCSFDGSSASPAALDHYNVSAVSKVGSGIYDISWITNFANANYIIVANSSTEATVCTIISKDVASAQMYCNTVGGSKTDSVINLLAFGTQ